MAKWGAPFLVSRGIMLPGLVCRVISRVVERAVGYFPVLAGTDVISTQRSDQILAFFSLVMHCSNVDYEVFGSNLDSLGW